MYQWIPQKSNKTAQRAILILLLGAILLFGFTAIFPNLAYRWVYQMIGLGMLTAVLFLVTRYVTRTYIYQIRGKDGEEQDLEILECSANGRKQITVCRISLFGLRSLTLLDLSDGGKSESFLAACKQEKKKIYNYCVDLQPQRSCLLLCDESGEELWIRLNYEPGLWEILSRFSPMDPSEYS